MSEDNWQDALIDLVDAICDVVDSSEKPWIEKRQDILDILGTDGKMKFYEFLSWFDPESGA